MVDPVMSLGVSRLSTRTVWHPFMNPCIPASYSALSGFVIFLVVLILYQKKKYQGQVFLWLLIMHSTARLALERFRGDDRGLFLSNNMTMTQFVAILILVVSVGILFVAKSKRKDQK